MEEFDTVEMASGGLALVLERKSTWEEFPNLSNKWISRLSARPLSKPTITFDECLVEVAISGGKFWITYDDFQSSVQLEPEEPRFNDIVMQLQFELRQQK